MDDGEFWQDLGAFQQSGNATDGHDSRNVWSGSVLSRSSGKQIWAAYTGICEHGNAHPFVQCLAVGRGIAGGSFETGSGHVLLSAVTDGERIRSAGYYLGRTEDIGSIGGELGGPITAWRDPFLFRDFDGELYVVWSAKRPGGVPAMGMARLEEKDDALVVKTLLPPAALPDESQFTQLEVPKIYLDVVGSRYILVVAATDRRSEAQEGSEIEASIRVYHATSLEGPWNTGGIDSSVLADVEGYFGMTVLRADATRNVLVCISPLTDQVEPDLALTISPRFTIGIADIGSVQRLTVGEDFGARRVSCGGSS